MHRDKTEHECHEDRHMVLWGFNEEGKSPLSRGRSGRIPGTGGLRHSELALQGAEDWDGEGQAARGILNRRGAVCRGTDTAEGARA